MSQQDTKTTNPLLEKRKRSLPGVTVRLPSKGKIYDTGVIHDSVNDGEVVVYPMRLKEELKMKSLDSIFQGTAISDTISYCVPEILEPEMLCPTDIDYLITTIKKQTHGDIFIYKDVCMKIEHLVNREELIEENAKQEFEEADRSLNSEENLDSISEQLNNLDNQIEKGDVIEDSEKNRPFDPVLDNTNNLGENSKFCNFQIPLSHFLDTVKEIEPDVYEEQSRFEFLGFDLQIQQINFTTFKEISNLRLQDNPNTLGEDQYSEYINKFSNINLSRRIRSVDNITDQNMIEEWVNTLSLQERTKLFDKIADIFDWGIDFKYSLTCSTCNQTKELDISYINPLYFFLIS